MVNPSLSLILKAMIDECASKGLIETNVRLYPYNDKLSLIILAGQIMNLNGNMKSGNRVVTVVSPYEEKNHSTSRHASHLCGLLNLN